MPTIDRVYVAVPMLEVHASLLFGGYHSKLLAPQALLEQACILSLTHDRIGSIAPFAAGPGAKADGTRAVGIHVIMGNCKPVLCSNAQDWRCGFGRGSACGMLSIAGTAHADRRLDEDTAATGAIRKVSLPDGYAGAMQTGLWSSSGALRPAEPGDASLPLTLIPVQRPAARVEACRP